MSGTRDFKHLLPRSRLGTLQCSRSEGDFLVSYLTGSRRRNGYAAVNYDRLLSQAETDKQAGQQQSLRIHQLASKGQVSRRQWLLRQHREAWKKERADIRHQISQCQLELSNWRAASFRDTKGGLQLLMEELFQEECDMAVERTSFVQQITAPVRDIRRKAGVLARGGREGASSAKENVVRLLQDTKKELVCISKHLEEEEEILNQFQEVCLWEETEEHRPLNAPFDLVDLPCPSIRLKSMMKEECVALDHFFQKQLLQLKGPHKESSLEDQWCEEDRVKFSLVFHQYPAGITHHRLLLMDRLEHEFPHKTRKEILAYEDCYRVELHRCAQQKVLKEEWNQAKTALLVKCKAACAEAMRQWYHRRALHMEREEQQSLCSQLHRKVKQLREESQLRALETTCQAELLLQRQLTASMKEKERERKRREGINKELQVYRGVKLKQEKEEMDQHWRRVREQQCHVAKQAIKNRARVEYRTSLMAHHKQQLVELEEKKSLEWQRMEDRLDQLRSTVRKEAGSDLDRTFGNTEASQARTKAGHDLELDLQQPLFPLHGFTDDKITTDKRFRVETALRQAGLLSSEYAHQVLANIRPSSQDCRNQESTLFK